MTDKARLEFSFDFKPTGKPRQPDQPMRLLIAANFGGENTSSTNSNRLRSVDIDTFDDLLENISPTVTVTSHSDTDTRLQFRSLDDFHPDELYNNLPPFKALRELRRKLQNTATFSAAAAEMMAGHGATEADPPTQNSPDSPASENTGESTGESADDAIERLLGRPASKTTDSIQNSNSPESTVDSLIQSLVAPHLLPAKDPQQDTLVRSVDASITSLMDQILHSPKMQALEARWRALFALVSNPQLDDTVQIYLWDTTHENLTAMVKHPDGDPMASDAAKLLASVDTPASWSVVASDLTISNTQDDLMLIAQLAAITSQFGSPLLACASPTLYGCNTSIATSPDSDHWLPPSAPSLAQWQQLRHSPIAEWIGLISPRLLQRLPYGEKTDPVDPFDYEEFTTQEHDKLLWGPPSIACAALLASAYCERQWNMQPGDHQEIEDLPAVTIDHQGQRGLMPCAEVILTDRSAESMVKHGVMPMISYKNRNAARLLKFQSISHSGASLAGPWSS